MKTGQNVLFLQYSIYYSFWIVIFAITYNSIKFYTTSQMPSSHPSVQYQKLRTNHKIFIYEGYQAALTPDGLRIEFLFSIEGLTDFRPVTLFRYGKYKKKFIRQYNENKELADLLIFNMGLIELISYWKSTCAPVIQVSNHLLSAGQIDWWKRLYFNGLGEFFYINGIEATPDDFVEIISSGIHDDVQSAKHMNDGFMVPVGGGKDSAVTLELLKNQNIPIIPLIINPRGASLDTITAAGLDKEDLMEILRSIDPELIRLNSLGYLNGHTPFSAMLAFYSLLASLLTGARNIALSNESSANEATIPGTHINHQYSKSYAFEQDFREYTTRFISPSFNYFSFLRPLNELQIVSVFSKLDHYHTVFKSCNVGSKTDEWCGKCPKCLFAHIMMSAFKGTAYANAILGAKMLEDGEMIGVFDELCGLTENKPFECVGTIEEVNQAIQMISRATDEGNKSLLVSRFLGLKKEEYPAFESSELNDHHNLSPELLVILKKALL